MKQLIFVFAIFLGCNTISVFGQSKIEGRVVDDTGEPIIGASVLINKLGIGTTTNINGEFKMMVPSDEYTLTFSYTGYASSQIRLKLKKKMDAKILFNIISGKVKTSYINNDANNQQNQAEALKELMTKRLNQEVALNLSIEKTFFSGLDYLPLTMPLEPSVKYFEASEMFPTLYKNKIVTYDQIAVQMRACILDESKIVAKLGFFRCGNGLAVVVYPHPVDKNGNKMDSAYVDNIPYSTVWSWSNIFGSFKERQKGYSRVIVFVFSDEPLIFNQPGDIMETRDFEDSLRKAGYSKDSFTGVLVPKRTPGCKVISYMFEHLDIDPEHPRLINTLSALDHLTRSNLLLHLTKYH